MLNILLGSPSFSTLCAVVVVLVGVALVAFSLREERRIQALGTRAPRIATYLPFGLGPGIDFVYRLIASSRSYVILEFFQHTFARHGSHTVEVNLGGERMILTDEPDNIRAVLATQFRDFGKGEPFHDTWEEFLGDSIFTTDLDQWHESRQLIRPRFVRDRLSDLEIFEHHVGILLRQMAGAGRVVDVRALFYRYTLDAATDFLMGHSVGSLENPQVEFAQAFADVQRMQFVFSMAGPLAQLFPRRQFRKNLRVINDFVAPYIDRALALSPEELDKKSSADAGYTFLHALAAFTRDRKVLRDQLVAVLIAGRDTTAATLSWTFYELARQPAVYQKLRGEILARLGADRAPTYEDLKALKYLQWTMNETLRLYPAVPLNVRVALHDTTLPLGGGPDGRAPVGMPKNTPVTYCTWSMQRRPDLYSPPSAPCPDDLAAFAPDRWATWTPRPWHYLPFNGGPRICIGQQFALTEMAYTIVRLLQRFPHMLPAGPLSSGPPMALRAEIVLQPAEEVRVVFRQGADDDDGVEGVKEGVREGVREGAKAE
ncbi:MAG: hypothetical protein M1826_001178 [Phylliscum demangeonii]|nr:MAG: hypothetical protein M1826_001178 [Phylliscum demangeonii]